MVNPRYGNFGILAERVVLRVWKVTAFYVLIPAIAFFTSPNINSEYAGGGRGNRENLGIMISWACICLVWFVYVVLSELRAAKNEDRNPFESSCE